MAISASPDPHLGSQKGQVPYSTGFFEPVNVSRNPEVGASTGHQLLFSDNRPLLISPEECDRLQGRATYVSNVPADLEGAPNPVNRQESNHDREPESNLDSRDDRETGHRVTPTVKRMVTTRTWALGNKVSCPCQSSSSCVLNFFIRNGNTNKEID